MVSMAEIEDSIVAIDGFSSCGKSTLAKELARELGYRFIDSGAMYRACTLYFLDNNININDLNAITKSLDNIHIEFQNIDGYNATILNGTNVTSEIRSLRVANQVSEVAAIKVVREKMVKLQHEMGAQKRIVMDGRDIGSVVFPNAEHKFFVTAKVDVRVQRRHIELITKGKKVTIDEVRKNLAHRDHIDSTRKESPLTQTPSHILIDNSYLTRAEQLLVALRHIEAKDLKVKSQKAYS